MDILPAIDLLDGRCVRLIQGRYDRVIDYEDDAVTVAQRFKDDGAQWVHIIDLDGARQGSIANLEAVMRIVSEVGLKVQFGGGIRDEAAVAAAIEAGVERVIVGTRALEDWEWFQTMVHHPEWTDKITLGLDAKLGKLSTNAWTIDTERTAVAVADQVASWPLANIVYTDIARDGMMLGPNLKAIRALSTSSEIPIVYSGGVTDLEDVRRLCELNLNGIVIGRAIYENVIDLSKVIEVASAA